jgi:hypothetical protein
MRGCLDLGRLIAVNRAVSDLRSLEVGVMRSGAGLWRRWFIVRCWRDRSAIR